MTGRKDVETVFFHATLQQVKRQELKLEKDEKHDHCKLHADLCDFATTRNNESVATMAANYNLVNGDDSWNAFFNIIAQANVFVEGPVAKTKWTIT